jgi:triosephosphate isomerase
MRKPIIAANWKMHKLTAEATAFAESFLPLVQDSDAAEIVLAPAFTALGTLGAALKGSAVQLAAQNVYPEEQGAFTAEISPQMLADLGCRYTIVGHSERRALFAEQDDFIARKALALLEVGIRPIVCVGEHLEEREANRIEEVVGGQLRGSLASIPAGKASEVVVAYEPVWAIGTGKTATPEMAQEVHAFIRNELSERFGGAAEAIRIQYGGSVKPENIADLMEQPDIDGALVGGASLDPISFAKVARLQRS